VYAETPITRENNIERIVCQNISRNVLLS